MSKSDDLTNKSLKDLEKKLNREYSQAYRELQKNASKYFATLDLREADLIEALDKGTIKLLPNEDRDTYLKRWREAQAGRGERWIALRDKMADRITRTNEIASAYINDETPSIYSINQQMTAYEIGKGLQGVDFAMYDEQAVKNLLVDKAGKYTEFRTVGINPKRDYEWNSDQIQKALSSAILQGKTMKQLASSFEMVMKRNRNSAIRNARTSYTSAQNGGRINSLKQARKQGIKVRKQWLSAHDARVRVSHAILNGQIRDVDKRFDNGLLYPADSDGRPAEVYNCRCTLTYIYDGIDDDVSSEIYEDEKLAGESYSHFVKRMNEENLDLIENNKARYGYRFEKTSAHSEALSSAGELIHPKLTRDERKAIIQKGVEQDRACFAYDTDRVKLASASKYLPKEGNKYDIIMHGANDYAKFFDQPIDAETLAQIIIQRSDYKKGTPIRLVSCSTGAEDFDGNCFAQELANKLNVTVSAPDDILYLVADGKNKVRIQVGDNDDGLMRDFIPVYR